MKIGFWNVQRLGSGTSEASKELVAKTVEWFFDNKDVEIFVLCEITSSTTISSGASSDLAIDKIGTIKKRLKKTASAQLGYAVVTKEGTDYGITASLVDIPDYADVYNFATYKKAGGNFKSVSVRGVLEFSHLLDGVDLYFYHANASDKAPYLVAWVAEVLRQRTENKTYPFVLIGDLNCEPAQLANQLRYYDSNLLKGLGYSDKFSLKYDGVTHHARYDASKVYDYAITGKLTAVTVTSWDTLVFSAERDRSDHPDHFPILIDFS